MEDLSLILYKTKAIADDRLSVRPGKKMTKVFKFFLGWCSVFLILLVLFGPMLLFSSLNPLTSNNGIESMEFTVSLTVNSIL